MQPQHFNAKQQMHRPNFELQYKRDMSLKDVALHHHDFYEVYYLVSGDVTYTIESRLYKVQPGDILLISPRELHQVHIQTSRSGYERFVLWLDPQFIRTLSTQATDLFQAMDPNRPGYRNQLRPQTAQQQQLRSLLEALYREEQSEDFGADLLPRSILTQLLVEINRLAQRRDLPLEDSSQTSAMVSRVVDFINENYAEPLTLDLLAERFYVSKYHLSHEFQRQVGTSVYRYIQKKRLQIARHLLSQGRKASQIPGLCGFGDYTGFYRAFRAEYGTTPREFAAAAGNHNT